MNVMAARLSGLAVAHSRPRLDGTGDEDELVRAAALGDQAAFERLYERYARMVHGILLARVRPCEVDDLMQDVFFAAFRRTPGLRAPEAFGAWLAAIARNRATQFHRDARSEAEAARASSATAIAPAESQTFEILEIIRRLPEAYRETLILRLVEGMTGPEIAERTGLTPDSVRVNLSRGMKLLREQLSGGASK
jgi:RNA polymerase sigma-70 factor (ECF subfamily)